MYLNIQGKHLKITPTINDYVKKRIKRIKKHFDNVLHIHVTLETIKNSHFAEANLSSEHHHFHNRIQSGDMYSSIDILFDKLEIQVRRYKEHQLDKKRHSSSLSSHFEEIEETSKKQNIVIEDLAIPVKPMSYLEATLQLRVDTKKNVMGFYGSTGDDGTDSKPNFIEQVDDSHFLIYSYDHYWERKETELIFPDNLEILSVSTVKPGYDFIENAIDFLRHNESRTRFFTSIRLDYVVLLHQLSNNKFEIIHE